MDVHDFFKIESQATSLFEEIRLMESDVTKIAHNTGIPEKILQAIKDHVFYKEHILSEGVRRFWLNIDMAEAWLRLIDGSFVQADLTLLLYEYAESLIMRGTEVSYMEAHPVIQPVYNWDVMILK